MEIRKQVVGSRLFLVNLFLTIHIQIYTEGVTTPSGGGVKFLNAFVNRKSDGGLWVNQLWPIRWFRDIRVLISLHCS